MEAATTVVSRHLFFSSAHGFQTPLPVSEVDTGRFCLNRQGQGKHVPRQGGRCTTHHRGIFFWLIRSVPFPICQRHGSRSPLGPQPSLHQFVLTGKRGITSPRASQPPPCAAPDPTQGRRAKRCSVSYGIPEAPPDIALRSLFHARPQ